MALTVSEPKTSDIQQINVCDKRKKKPTDKQDSWDLQ